MDVREMQYDIKFKLNKVDSQQNKNLNHFESQYRFF